MLEANDYDNWTRFTEVREACEQEGMIFTIWLTRPFDAALVRQTAVESECSGVLVEGEIPAMNPGPDGVGEVPNPQAVNWPELIFTLSDLDIFKGVATNFAPFTHHDGSPYPEKSRPLVEAGWACLTECYDMPFTPAPLRPAERAGFAKHLGWNVTQPILGLYGGDTLGDYPTRDDYRNWSVWAAEYVI